MSDLLASGASWLADQLAAGAAKSCRYYRGMDYGVVNATIGRSQFEAQNTSGVIETWQSHDFIVRSGMLPFGDPMRGDRIVETLNGVDVTFEVASPHNTAWWEYADSFRQTVRIHTVAKSESSKAVPTLLRRFWGSFAGDAITDSQIVSSLSSDLGGSRAQARTIAAASAYLYVILPTSFGVPTFAVGGLTSSAWQTTTRTITFSGQAATSYGIYRSTYQITGTVTLVVS